MEKTIEYGAWKFNVDILAIENRGIRLMWNRDEFCLLQNKPKDVAFEYEGRRYAIPTREDVWQMYDDIGKFLMNKALEERTERELFTLRNVSK